MAGVSSKAPAFFNTRPTMSDFDNAASPTPRACVPALDAILGKTFKVLDVGFVRAVDYMGSDVSIVQAARVSYGEGTKKASDDEHLIRYLMRHRHTTPFEMCELKLHVRVPMAIWRQWVRHRTASINEYSTRYSIAIDSAHATDPREWRTQSTTNRQGSGDIGQSRRRARNRVAVGRRDAGAIVRQGDLPLFPVGRVAGQGHG